MKAIIIVLTMLMSLNANGNEDIRYDTATVTSNHYFEEAGCSIACFTDSNGNDWIMYDIDAPVGSECVIEYDTKGTDDIYDDEITNIIYFSDIVELVDASETDWDKIESRNGNLIIERAVGVVDDSNGNGHVIDTDYYVNYSRVHGVSKGDVVVTYFFYNPHTNYADDITARYDIVMN